MVICIIGPSGSGKDTQAEKLSEELNIPDFSIGAVMREKSKQKHPLALKAMEYAEKGKWAPAEVTVALMLEYISENTPTGFIVTGFPRETVQFELLGTKLAEIGLKYSAVVHYEIPDEVALTRMKKQAAEMEAAGKPRPDATEELMQKRLDSYHKTIEPVLTMAKEKDLLVNIDATPAKKEITATTLKKLAEKLKLEL